MHSPLVCCVSNGVTGVFGEFVLASVVLNVVRCVVVVFDVVFVVIRIRVRKGVVANVKRGVPDVSADSGFVCRSGLARFSDVDI